MRAALYAATLDGGWLRVAWLLAPTWRDRQAARSRLRLRRDGIG